MGIHTKHQLGEKQSILWMTRVCTYHNVELFRLRNELHTTVVYNDFIILNPRVLLRNLPARLQEQTISKFHDVCFMHCCHFFSIVKVCILKSILGNPFWAKLCYHLPNAWSESIRGKIHLDGKKKSSNVICILLTITQHVGKTRECHKNMCSEGLAICSNSRYSDT
jgi:hypothetical protein